MQEVVKRFSVFEPYYPLWIDVYVNGNDITELHTSLRFRKPSELLRRATRNRYKSSTNIILFKRWEEGKSSLFIDGMVEIMVK